MIPIATPAAARMQALRITVPTQVAAQIVALVEAPAVVAVAAVAVALSAIFVRTLCELCAISIR